MEEKDIARRFKTKTIGADGKEKTIKLFIKQPSKKVIRDAQFQYGKHWSNAIREGYFTEEEAREILKKRNIITEEYTRQVEAVQQEIFDTAERLSEISEKTKEGYDLSLKLRTLRLTYFSLLNKENEIMRNTAEAYASDIRDAYIAAQCTYVDSVQPHPFFKSYDDLVDRSDDIATQDAILNTIYVIYGTESPKESFIENIWLDKYKLLDEEGNILDFKDEESNVQPPKKKRSQKKK